MARPRTNLQAKLEEILGSTNVYFQPPPSFTLTYPCIVYELSDIDVKPADNIKYASFKRYEVTYISKKYDEAMIDLIMRSFDHISFSRPYRADNLYHYVFFVYY